MNISVFVFIVPVILVQLFHNHFQVLGIALLLPALVVIVEGQVVGGGLRLTYDSHAEHRLYFVVSGL